MAESVDNSSSEGSESSDYDAIFSSELSTSCESSSKEQSCSRGKGKVPAAGDGLLTCNTAVH